jgi:hypothetical protein
MTKPIYEKRVILFLDILGFKELIALGEEQKIFNILSTSYAFSNSSPSFPDSTHTTAFSDLIVVSYRMDSAGVINVINTASMLAWSFLQQGILTRGGIASGDVHHTKERLFGPAVIQAYKLENELAIFPRILVSDDIVEHFFEGKSGGQINEVTTYDSEVLRQDFDGVWYLHLLSHGILSPFNSSFSEKKERFDKKIEVIENALDNPCPPIGSNKRARAKHNWLRNYLNQ